MQKFEAVATPMKTSIESIQVVNQTDLNDFSTLREIRPSQVFSDEGLEYLDELSKLLIKDSSIREYPDVATFAFYCRKANLINLRNAFLKEGRIKVGRGIIFHIAPSNVPVNFAYSLVAGLLSGNANVIKIPSGNFQQVDMIVSAINKLSMVQKYRLISEKIILVKYSRENVSATKLLSGICNVRVIWGGDKSIESVRRNELQPRAFDITFSDRYSLCVINADNYIHEKSPRKIADGFYNDTYLFDQNACTSPHLIVWLGLKENVKKSQSIFWGSLHELVKEKYMLDPIQAIDKVSQFYNQSLSGIGASKVEAEDNLIWRIQPDKIDSSIEEFRCIGGYFNEYHASSISEIANLANTKYQTMSYYGLSRTELESFVFLDNPMGIDRIVPIGKTMDFSLIWDGYDLISSLSREVEII